MINPCTYRKKLSDCLTLKYGKSWVEKAQPDKRCRAEVAPLAASATVTAIGAISPQTIEMFTASTRSQSRMNNNGGKDKGTKLVNGNHYSGMLFLTVQREY